MFVNLKVIIEIPRLEIVLIFVLIVKTTIVPTKKYRVGKRRYKSRHLILMFMLTHPVENIRLK